MTEIIDILNKIFNIINNNHNSFLIHTIFKNKPYKYDNFYIKIFEIFEYYISNFEYGYIYLNIDRDEYSTKYFVININLINNPKLLHYEKVLFWSLMGKENHSFPKLAIEMPKINKNRKYYDIIIN